MPEKKVPQGLKSTTKLPSLSKKEAQAEEKKSTQKESQTEKKRNSVTIEDVKFFWNAFRDKRKEMGRDRELNVLNQPFEFDNEVIKLKLLNPIQSDILNDFRDSLMDYLRSQLKNDHLSLEIEFIKHDDRKMIYTAKEKLDHLIEKNPQLKNLKDQLGLDNEY